MLKQQVVCLVVVMGTFGKLDALMHQVKMVATVTAGAQSAEQLAVAVAAGELSNVAGVESKEQVVPVATPLSYEQAFEFLKSKDLLQAKLVDSEFAKRYKGLTADPQFIWAIIHGEYSKHFRLVLIKNADGQLKWSSDVSTEEMMSQSILFFIEDLYSVITKGEVHHWVGTSRGNPGFRVVLQRFIDAELLGGAVDVRDLLYPKGCDHLELSSPEFTYHQGKFVRASESQRKAIAENLYAEKIKPLVVLYQELVVMAAFFKPNVLQNHVVWVIPDFLKIGKRTEAQTTTPAVVAVPPAAESKSAAAEAAAAHVVAEPLAQIVQQPAAASTNTALEKRGLAAIGKLII